MPIQAITKDEARAALGDHLGTFNSRLSGLLDRLEAIEKRLGLTPRRMPNAATAADLLVGAPVERPKP